VVGLKPTTGRLADDHGAAHGAYTSLTVSGPIANSVPDLLLMYAVMANVDYADADTRKPGSAALCLPGVEAAAAAAANMRPRALQLPEALVQVADEAAISTEQRVLLDSQPLRGVRVGVYDKVRVRVCS
jgi:Asp-tRNA(Asn)/Glu-tRNA(Gln) amidotransferase A subunit family amidase